jgi:hypothetical protein
MPNLTRKLHIGTNEGRIDGKVTNKTINHDN